MLKNLKNLNSPELEAQVLEFWERNHIFEESLELRKNGKPFRFFEGPPTANGLPGVHHTLARVFKDVILRYRTMRGQYVLRRAGWDTHGLPVEIAIEKELGIKHKSEIEKLGIAEFNQRARLSVWRYKTEWERFTKRIGFWLDFANPYITYENSYIETLWWIFREIDKKRLLTKLHKVIPWCTRCQTPLSNNELGQPGVYQKTKDPSVYVKFLLSSSKNRKKGKEYLLVWTTTPWTLPGNVAIALNPKVAYTKYKVGDDFLWALSMPAHLPGTPESVVVEKVAGAKLVGLSYEPLYSASLSPKEKKEMYKVLPADFVSTEDGTGFVHIAPAFGDDDFKLIQSENQKRATKAVKIPILITVDDRGMVKKGLPGAGKFLKDADKDIAADLEKRGSLFRAETIEHEYPFCWRCQRPLIYLARLTWFIEMSRLKNDLLRSNKTINWIPGHLKDGRFGEWLKEGKDWSISRERYWGTPLPIWEGDSCDHQLVAGSFKDLNTYRYGHNRFFTVRHGEAEQNVNQTLAGIPEGKNPPRLTEEGRRQANAVAEHLKKEKINLILCSPNKRARETAMIISKATKAKVVVDDRLREIDFGSFNGGPESRYKAFFENFADRFSKRPPGGESWSDVRKRMINVVSETDRTMNGKRIAIVSHGDPLWLLLGAAEGISDANMKSAPYLGVGEWREMEFPNWPFSKEGEIDFHRPFVDEIVLKCPECGGKMHRVKEVADVWFDSGAMPYAEWHYPFENKEMIDRKKHFPADYIVEGVDQTRGWFYTLLAVSTLLGKEAPYKNVISTGLVLDKHGQKMSKSRGNVVDPVVLLNNHGADALRWYFYTVNDPADSKKFDEEDIKKTFRKVFLILWNTYLFLETYRHEKHEPIHALDAWIQARLQETTRIATAKLDKFTPGDAAQEIERFVEDLSRWYVRRSRKNVSPIVLERVLVELSKLLAPFAPFFAEALYQALAPRVKSVHLEDWALTDFTKTEKDAQKKIIDAMAEVRRLASLALAARESAGLKVRQPLSTLTVKTKNVHLKANHELLQLLRDEVNVKHIAFGGRIKGDVMLDTTITPELYAEGIAREFSRAIQDLRKDAGCNVGDVVEVAIRTTPKLALALRGVLESIKHSVGASHLSVHESSVPDATWSVTTEAKIDGEPTWIGVRKV